VTSHLIDHRVDAGRILERREISLATEDTLFDLSERLYETQVEMLVTAIKRARAGQWEQIAYEATDYNRKMSAELEAGITELLPAYLERRGND
jgi:phosphoribosylglycinamide formyltransferase-1